VHVLIQKLLILVNTLSVLAHLSKPRVKKGITY